MASYKLLSIKEDKISYIHTLFPFIFCILFLLLFIGQASFEAIMYGLLSIVVGSALTYFLEAANFKGKVRTRYKKHKNILSVYLFVILVTTFIIIVLSIFYPQQLKQWSWLIVWHGFITGQQLGYLYSKDI